MSGTSSGSSDKGEEESATSKVKQGLSTIFTGLLPSLSEAAPKDEQRSSVDAIAFGAALNNANCLILLVDDLHFSAFRKKILIYNPARHAAGAN